MPLDDNQIVCYIFHSTFVHRFASVRTFSFLNKGVFTVAFSMTNKKGVQYWLHSKQVTLKNNLQRTIFFFSKTQAGAVDVPVGYEPVEARTGLPVLKRAE